MVQPTQRPRHAGFTNDVINRVTINQAMQESAILPIKPELIKVKDNRDTATITDTVERIFERQQEDGLYRKILITCFPGDELKQLKDAFLRINIPVAYTSAETGKRFAKPDGTCTEYVKVSDFSRAITDYEGNLVILHIRQMTAGVDVSAITSVLTRVFDNTAENIVKMIQTNGRALRFMKGERGLPIESRLKKYGEVFCMVQEESFDQDARFLIRFFNVMYGTEAVSVFRIGHDRTMPKMQPPTMGDVQGRAADLPGDWSEAEFYLIRLLREHRDEIAWGAEIQDEAMQTGILEQLLTELDQVTQLNQTDMDMSWYSADRALSRTWELADLQTLGLFH